MKRRAAITGIGVISPVGVDHESTFDALLAGRSGVGPITLFDPTEYKTRIAAEVKDFDPTTRLDAKLVRQVDRFCQIGLPAGLAAWNDSGLDISALDPTRVGVVAGSGIGGLSTIESQTLVLSERGPGRVTPRLIPRLMLNALSGELSILLGLKGPNWVTASACASASHALGSGL
ncbi:MAG: beta-ketoacyl synthase N-terminal-like domain-containing protein, partial [Planctomycetota bacterium]|nr:beta-ketoacyl synthase N-terminal-like domain-containing protein [Planctomycetota bacterium]